jgi:hypothetical protein
MDLSGAVPNENIGKSGSNGESDGSQQQDKYIKNGDPLFTGINCWNNII